MNPADNLTQAGFVLSAEDGWLWVEPTHLLTPELRTFIRDHKAEILQALTGGGTPDAPTALPASAEPPAAAPAPTPAPTQTPAPALRQSRPQTLLQGDAAWQAHRWACTSCATAWQPQHRCPTGQGLWAALRPA